MNAQLPDIKFDFAQWYQEIVYRAELADLSPVRGSLVIRPYGYALWEHIKSVLDDKIKKTGHHNMAFPLLIPQSFIEREAKHVEGFAPELAVVTIAGGKKLEEPLVIRPTSETMVYVMFAKWIKSWRDLPYKINQWANVMRWELRTRPFLRTSEFFWQEGHTAHETPEEAEQEALTMLEEYVDVYQNYLAIPVISGKKSEYEKFAGADTTYTVEGLMQDGKALQMCTSHRISQSFAKSFDIKFQDRDGNLAYPHLTSWGFTTRSVGAVVMVHGDQKGLIMPPKVAPIQVIIIPIFKKGIEPYVLKNAAHAMAQELGRFVRVHVDDDESVSPGAKFYHWELKGVPIRLEIGPRDLEQNNVIMVDRIGSPKESVSLYSIGVTVQERLADIHEWLFERAQQRMNALWYKRNDLATFGPELEERGGFYQVGWCGQHSCEQKLKEYKASVRCLLPDKQAGYCFACQQPSIHEVLVAKAY